VQDPFGLRSPWRRALAGERDPVTLLFATSSNVNELPPFISRSMLHPARSLAECAALLWAKKCSGPTTLCHTPLLRSARLPGLDSIEPFPTREEP
jgi:hypothetical protein